MIKLTNNFWKHWDYLLFIGFSTLCLDLLKELLKWKKTKLPYRFPSSGFPVEKMTKPCRSSLNLIINSHNRTRNYINPHKKKKNNCTLKKMYISAFTGATCLPSPWVFLWLLHLSATANAEERWIDDRYSNCSSYMVKNRVPSGYVNIIT